MVVGLLLTLLIVLAVALIGLSMRLEAPTLEAPVFGSIEFQSRCVLCWMSFVVKGHRRQIARLPVEQSHILPQQNPHLFGPARDVRYGLSVC